MANRHFVRRILELLDKLRTVTVVGAFRCGTNYLAKLLFDNTRLTVRYDTFGWKHGPLSAEGRKPFPGTMAHRIISVSKDPFSFLVSFHSYVRKQQRNVQVADDWETFVTSPIVIFNQGTAGSVRFCFASPVAYWNFINSHHLLLPQATFRLSLIRYDDLLRDTPGTVRRLFDEQAIRPKTKILIRPQSCVASDRPLIAQRRSGGQGFRSVCASVAQLYAPF